MEDLKDKKRDAEKFLTEQISKLSEAQKQNLSYVLFGATMSQNLLGKSVPAKALRG